MAIGLGVSLAPLASVFSDVSAPAVGLSDAPVADPKAGNLVTEAGKEQALKKYALLFLRKRNGTPPYISRRYGFVTKFVFFLVDKNAP